MRKSTHTHEFKAPINRIKGLVQILCTDPSLTPHDRTAIKGLIDTNTNRLQRSAESLLLYFTWEDQEINRGLLNVSDLEKELPEHITAARFSHKAEVHTHINCSTDSLEIDLEWWWLAIDHLLSNAFKFSVNGDISIALKANTKGVTFEIQDKGIGMRSVSKATEAFWQESAGLNRMNSGLGLGLTLTHRIAVAHGGNLHLHSQPGAGCTATLFLPSA